MAMTQGDSNKKSLAVDVAIARKKNVQKHTRKEINKLAKKEFKDNKFLLKATKYLNYK